MIVTDLDFAWAVPPHINKIPHIIEIVPDRKPILPFQNPRFAADYRSRFILQPNETGLAIQPASTSKYDHSVRTFLLFEA